MKFVRKAHAFGMFEVFKCQIPLHFVDMMIRTPQSIR